VPPPFQALPDDPPPGSLPDPAPETTTGSGPAAGPGAADAAAPRGAPGGVHLAEGRLGLLGPPASGKSTFLAALRIAVEQGAPGWMLYGEDDDSNRFLKESTDRLRRQRVFPSATANLMPNMRFVLRGPRHVVRRRGLRSRREKEVAAVVLDVLDAPGGLYGGHAPEAVPEPSEDGTGLGSGAAAPKGAASFSTGEQARLASHLANSAGLILLVDPVGEESENDAYDHFQSVVLEIAKGSALLSRDEFLPQYLAVCLTKFDHPHVYGKARELGLVSEMSGTPGFPYVPERMAKEYFTELCEGPRPGKGWSSSSARQLRNAIRQHFSPRRTRFFMTSAVGFHLDPVTGLFRSSDPMNVSYESATDGGSRPWITGDVRPVNVLEPVLWLAATQVRNRS